jgi:regulator of cell morphogenesis and NO signaling
MIDRSKTEQIKDIVLKYPASYRVFYKHGIDFCCGGKAIFFDVCQEKGINYESVLEEIEALSQTVSDNEDWTKKDPKELINHIVQVHHAYLKEEFPRLNHLAKKVAGRHGSHQKNLNKLAEVFALISEDLLDHMEKEERDLFPAIIKTENKEAVICLIDQLEKDHEETGKMMETLIDLTNNYAISDDMCDSYKALYIGLSKFDEDIRLHIHKENNILFPMFLI